MLNSGVQTIRNLLVVCTDLVKSNIYSLTVQSICTGNLRVHVQLGGRCVLERQHRFVSECVSHKCITPNISFFNDKTGVMTLPTS